MVTPDCRSETRPPFDGLRAYLRAVQSRDELQRIRQLEQRNGGLKRSVERLVARHDVAPQCPECGSKTVRTRAAFSLAVLFTRLIRILRLGAERRPD